MVEPQFVVLVVAGSSPVGHPNPPVPCELQFLRCFRHLKGSSPKIGDRGCFIRSLVVSTTQGNHSQAIVFKASESVRSALNELQFLDHVQFSDQDF